MVVLIKFQKSDEQDNYINLKFFVKNPKVLNVRNILNFKDYKKYKTDIYTFGIWLCYMRNEAKFYRA